MTKEIEFQLKSAKVTMNLTLSAKVELTDDLLAQLQKLMNVLSAEVQALPGFELLPPGVTITLPEKE